MQRRQQYIASGLALLLFLVIVVVVKNSPLSSGNPSPASTLTGVASNLTGSTTQSTATTTGNLSAATSTPASTTPSASHPKPAALPAPTISTATVQARELAGSGTQLLKALVNIICISDDPSIPSISGTGVIIDSRGIILTAAHVAQLFLLQDYMPNKVECLIRSGSPARRAYLAQPIYVSQSWIAANPSTLKTAGATGNGQYDVALLGITDTATSTSLPSSFPYVPLAAGDPVGTEQVAIGSYGAQYLTSSELNLSLYPILVFGGINKRYTYSTNTVDLFSMQGTAASQEGSSGGGVANIAGKLIGMITTSSIDGDIQGRTLNAITPGHLRRTYAADMGKNFDSTLANESVSSLIADFKQESLKLGQILYQNTESK